MAGMVIIGGGLAGGRAARTLREDGYSGEITVIASEPQPPYQRPPLSKGYLQGTEGLDAVYLKPEEWYSEQRITLHTGIAATAINPSAHTVALADGSSIAYDKLLIATGSRARSLPIEGHDLTGVHSLRTLADAEALKTALSGGGKNLVLIGSGWIGMEVAASARALGNTVTILERGAVPLSVALGDMLGAEFKKLHEAHGVVFHMDANVERIVGDGAAGGAVTGVQFDGQVVPADLVLVGVGAIPNTELAEAAGLEVQNGVLTDASLRTSDPDIFAAGDVANALHPSVNHRLRSEHWSNAINEGKAAARAMLGQEVSYDEIPYFYSDQYDLGMELSGYPHLMSDAEIVVRGDLASGAYLAFWVLERRVVAGMNVNIWDVNEHVQALIRSGDTIDAARLADPAVPLDSLLHV